MTWTCHLNNGEAPAPEGHVAHKTIPPLLRAGAIPLREVEALAYAKPSTVFMHNTEPLDVLLASLPLGTDTVVLPVLYVEDKAGEVARGFVYKVAYTRGTHEREYVNPLGPVPKDASPIVILTGHPWLYRPAYCSLFEDGYYAGANLVLTKGEAMDFTGLKARYEVKLDTALDTEKAVSGFEVLFTHMSLHEELGRLKELFRFLPYTMENHPKVRKLVALLDKQIGHLKKGEHQWYANGSPSEVASLGVLTQPMRGVPHRVTWMIEEARKHGLKRVLELGSVDGFNLFDYQQLAPEIEWHGVEVNPKAVAHGHLLAEQLGTKLNLHNAKSFEQFADSVLEREPGAPARFDAVAVFEVLEHNFKPWDVLRSAEELVRPGGRVYITTPNGSWSRHDKSTLDLNIHKDHINAFTVERMLSLIEGRSYRAKNLEVFEMENPAFQEANSWVYATYEVE